MNNQNLNSVIYTMSDTIDGREGHWRFVIHGVTFICITDELHNRMRVIAPVIEANKVSDEQLMRCMQAHFHTALDVKYAVSDELLWSVFIHPLKELTKEQFIDAVSQVYSCVRTFGQTYSSGALSFPTREERDANRN